MKYLIIIFVLIIAGCSKDNLELSKKTSQINNDKDLIFITEEICNNFQSTEEKVYGCGSAISDNMEISREKALLMSKVIIADIISSSLNKKQSHIISETTEEGINKIYKTSEVNEVFEQSIPNYKIVYQKTFKEKTQYRTFVVIEYLNQV